MFWKKKCPTCNDTGRIHARVRSGSLTDAYCLCPAGDTRWAAEAEKEQKPEPEPVAPPVPQWRKDFDHWLGRQGFGEVQRGHFRAAFDIVTGHRPCPPDFNLPELRKMLEEAEAPLPKPLA